MNNLDKIYQRHSTPTSYATAYADHLKTLVSQMDFTAIGDMIEIFLRARENGSYIFFCGNGGSAATASHFANDIAIGTRCLDKPFRATSLTDNVAVMTAISNDDGYEHIFTQQLKVLMKPGDILVAISASGNSENIIAAIQYAHTLGNHTIGLTGFDGGKLRTLVTTKVHIQTGPGEYGPVEDIHMIVDHLISSYLIRAVSSEV